MHYIYSRSLLSTFHKIQAPQVISNAILILRSDYSLFGKKMMRVLGKISDLYSASLKISGFLDSGAIVSLNTPPYPNATALRPVAARRNYLRLLNAAP